MKTLASFIRKAYPVGRSYGCVPTSQRGMYKVFEIETCGNCGGQVQAANAINLSKTAVDMLVAEGRSIVALCSPLPESYYSDDTPSNECCDNCA